MHAERWFASGESTEPDLRIIRAVKARLEGRITW